MPDESIRPSPAQPSPAQSPFLFAFLFFFFSSLLSFFSLYHFIPGPTRTTSPLPCVAMHPFVPQLVSNMLITNKPVFSPPPYPIYTTDHMLPCAHVPRMIHYDNPRPRNEESRRVKRKTKKHKLMTAPLLISRLLTPPPLPLLSTSRRTSRRVRAVYPGNNTGRHPDIGNCHRRPHLLGADSPAWRS